MRREREPTKVDQKKGRNEKDKRENSLKQIRRNAGMNETRERTH